jgi:hypothetical protein
MLNGPAHMIATKAAAASGSTSRSPRRMRRMRPISTAVTPRVSSIVALYSRRREAGPDLPAIY